MIRNRRDVMKCQFLHNNDDAKTIAIPVGVSPKTAELITIMRWTVHHDSSTNDTPLREIFEIYFLVPKEVSSSLSVKSIWDLSTLHSIGHKMDGSKLSKLVA